MKKRKKTQASKMRERHDNKRSFTLRQGRGRVFHIDPADELTGAEIRAIRDFMYEQAKQWLKAEIERGKQKCKS